MVNKQHHTKRIHKSIDGLCVSNSRKVEFECVRSVHTVFTQCAYSERTVKRFLFNTIVRASSYTLSLIRSSVSCFSLLCSVNGVLCAKKIVRKKF